MAATFEEAKAIALADARSNWKAANGTLMVAAEGFEDATHWQVVVGSSEWLVDRDLDFQLLDVPALLVSKESGAVTRLSVIDNLDRLGKMTPVS